MNLRISSKCTLPPESVTETFAILGIRGSGKTNTAVVMAEELLKQKRQVVIIDPVDVWWGLKSSKDGRQPGFPIPVIGGEHADVPLDGAAGIVLADFVVDTRASVILTLRHLSMNDQRRFAGDFAKRLYERKGAAEHRSPLHLIVDEADEFVPQRIQKGHEAMFGAFDRLVRRGRSSGIGITLISQRPQVLNKDVLSQMEVLVAMRVLHKLDRDALKAWTEAHDTEGHQEEFLESLPALEKGEGWIWSPSWMNLFQRVQIRERETFDSSATPKAGQQLAPPKELAPVDLDRLKQSMQAQIEKAKADDPRALRAEISKLKLELQKAGKPESQKSVQVDQAAIERAVVAAAAKGAKEATAEAARIMTPARRAMQKTITLLREAAQQLETALPPESMTLKVSADLPRFTAPYSAPHRSPVPPPRPPRQVDPQSNGSAPPSKGGRRILTALAQFGTCPDTKIGALTGYTAGAGHFGNLLSELRAGGYVEGDRSALQITDAGLSALGTFEPLPSGVELQQYWYGRLSKGAADILRELVEAYPASLSDESIAESIGREAKAGHFGNCLSELRTRDLISGERRALKASEDLF